MIHTQHSCLLCLLQTILSFCLSEPEAVCSRTTLLAVFFKIYSIGSTLWHFE